MLPPTARIAIMLATVICVTGCAPEKKQQETPRTAAPQPVEPLGQTGEELFRQFCSSCHPDGGNVSDPAKSLRGTVLKANRITTPDDIVRIMRQPGERMIRFDKSNLPDREARAIAEYVLKAFK